MKKKYSYLFFALAFASCKTSHSQQPSLTIHYSYSEKSRDSHSTVENISLTGTVLTYSVKYSGRRGPNQTDENKTCTLSSEQVSTINTIISEKKLNVTDSLIDNTPADESYNVTTGISITVTSGNKTTKTNVYGKPSALQGKPLYKNSLYLLDKVKDELEKCH